MKTIEMIKGAQKLVDECTKVREGENVLILTDTVTSLSIAEVVAIACKERGAEAMIMIMSPTPVEGNDPPPPVAAAMQKAQVIFMACSRSIFHTPSRVQATKGGARCFVFSEFTEEDMFSGAIEANLPETRKLLEKVGEALGKAKEARVTTSAGTDIYLDFRGRLEKVLILNAMCHEPGDAAVMSLEAAISPKLGTAQGVIVCDAVVTLFRDGLLKEPVRATIKNGVMTEISGGAEAKKVRDSLAAMNDPLVYNVVELGIGCNPKAKLTGVKIHQDKAVYGTGHIGFGSNLSWGGNIKAATHYDFIMYTPKIELDGIAILENHQFHL